MWKLRCEVVGERLDPAFDGAARFAEPAVISDQLAIAHAVDHRGELGWGEVVTHPFWRAAIAASGVVVFHTFGMWRATSPGAKL